MVSTLIENIYYFLVSMLLKAMFTHLEKVSNDSDFYKIKYKGLKFEINSWDILLLVIAGKLFMLMYSITFLNVNGKITWQKWTIFY